MLRVVRVAGLEEVSLVEHDSGPHRRMFFVEKDPARCEHGTVTTLVVVSLPVTSTDFFRSFGFPESHLARMKRGSGHRSAVSPGVLVLAASCNVPMPQRRVFTLSVVFG